MPVAVTPEELTFGVSSRQAPVDTAMEQTLTIASTHKSDLLCAVEDLTAAGAVRAKYKLAFEPAGVVVVPARGSVEVCARLTLLCTTKVRLALGVKVWKARAAECRALRLEFATESQLTTRLDPDEVQRDDDVIGNGAYGIVYSGTYRGMDVAVKVLKNQDCLMPYMVEDFDREVAMMEKLRHIAIVSFIGAVHIPGHLQIVTELCPYGALLPAMQKYPARFTDALRVKSLLDAAAGMDFLHRSGIIHRDLKPDNLLMVSLEPLAAVACKLSDFGTTRDVNSFARDIMRTNGVGTPLFMAPEILAGQPYDRPVDVFSFSLIIYTAFAGELPFEREKIAATPWGFVEAVLGGARPAVPRTCPPDVARLMVYCWDRDPAKRPTFEDIHAFFRTYFKENYKEQLL